MTTQIHPAETGHDLASRVGWQGRLDDAQGSDEVVALARDFLARISPEEFSRLAPDCRPRKLVDADDVVDYAVTLARRSCATDNLSDALLHHMAAFFNDAARQISRLSYHRPEAASRQ